MSLLRRHRVRLQPASNPQPDCAILVTALDDHFGAWNLLDAKAKPVDKINIAKDRQLLSLN